MSARNQILLNATALVRLLVQGKFSKARFVTSGLLRGIAACF